MDRFGSGGSGASTRYYLFDGLGSTAGLVDSAGTLTDTYAYDAFGTPSHQSGTSANNFLFNGQQFDEQEGLYYLRVPLPVC